jgi:hypothetical protein
MSYIPPIIVQRRWSTAWLETHDPGYQCDFCGEYITSPVCLHAMAIFYVNFQQHSTAQLRFCEQCGVTYFAGWQKSP